MMPNAIPIDPPPYPIMIVFSPTPHYISSQGTKQSPTHENDRASTLLASLDINGVKENVP
jgi:hypothetical protein